eukprot:TRINITY_DN61311_c0_g2_i1.p1 TRINITY_DN61311_c0_g2~~TRINITY_DN61311_c0_g2_i1.p1  ORF type:complete len:876 (+),score=-33.26 TRINITY_DN61311_c0_g2_i1:22-2649(+)
MLFWDTLYNCVGANLYETIVDVFAQRCFTAEIVHKHREKLLKVMPIYHTYMYSNNLHQKTYKYILEEAQKVGYVKAKADSEDTMLFEACFIVLLHFKPDIREKLIMDFQSFLNFYPSFKTDKEIDDKEIMKLLLFHNMMTLALQVIHAKFKKQHLIELVTRLSEGNQKKYCLGGGQSVFVNRRVTIYETVGGVTKQPRAPRWNEIISTLTSAFLPSNHSVDAKNNTEIPSYDENNSNSNSSVRRYLSDNSKENSSQPQRKVIKIDSSIVNTEEHGDLQVTTNEIIDSKVNVSVRASTISQTNPSNTNVNINNQPYNIDSNSIDGMNNIFDGVNNNSYEVVQHVVISDLNGNELFNNNNNTFGIAEESNAMMNDNSFMIGDNKDNLNISSINNTIDISNVNNFDNMNNGINNTNDDSLMAFKPTGDRNHALSESKNYNSDREVLDLLFESGLLEEDEDVILSYCPSSTSSRFPLNSNGSTNQSNNSSTRTLYRGDSSNTFSNSNGSHGGNFSANNSFYNNNNTTVNIVEYNESSISIHKEKLQPTLITDTNEIDSNQMDIASAMNNNTMLSPLSEGGGNINTPISRVNSNSKSTTSLLEHPSIRKLLNMERNSCEVLDVDDTTPVVEATLTSPAVKTYSSSSSNHSGKPPTGANDVRNKDNINKNNDNNNSSNNNSPTRSSNTFITYEILVNQLKDDPVLSYLSSNNSSKASSKASSRSTSTKQNNSSKTSPINNTMSVGNISPHKPMKPSKPNIIFTRESNINNDNINLPSPVVYNNMKEVNYNDPIELPPNPNINSIQHNYNHNNHDNNYNNIKEDIIENVVIESKISNTSTNPLEVDSTFEIYDTVYKSFSEEDNTIDDTNGSIKIVDNSPIW